MQGHPARMDLTSEDVGAPYAGRCGTGVSAAPAPARAGRRPARARHRMVAVPGVYAPQADTALLARAMRDEGVGSGTRLLDLCTGSGALALEAALLGAHVTAVDIGLRAVAATRLNALLNRRRITVHRGDLLEPLPGRRFDMVVSNPPYVPAPRATPPRHGPARSWDAGCHGRLLLDRICADAPGALRPGGVLLVVHSALSDPGATLRRLAVSGLRGEISHRERVPFGPVLRSRLPWLRAQGLLHDHENTEELVVIRARAS